MAENSKYTSLELPFDFDAVVVGILYGGKSPQFFEWSEKIRGVFSQTQKSVEDGKILSEDAPIYKAFQEMPEDVLAIAIGSLIASANSRDRDSANDMAGRRIALCKIREEYADPRDELAASRKKYADYCIDLIKSHLEDLKKEGGYTSLVSEQNVATPAQKILEKKPSTNATDRVEDSRGADGIQLK